MGPGVDKLFLEVAGRPVVAHTWERFDRADCIGEVVLVVRDGMQRALEELRHHAGFRKPVRFAIGGRERQDSVWSGLQAVSPGAELVAIQDAARPCTPLSVIEETLAAAGAVGAAVAARRITDTVKESDEENRVLRTVDRSRLWAVQTPQCFRLAVIRAALAEVRRRGVLVTDDTAACELIGQPVQLVETREANPKVTVPADLPYVESVLRQLTAGGAG